MDLSKLLTTNSVVLDLKGTTKLEILEEMISILKTQEKIEDEGLFLKDVLEREEIGTTGIGNHISIPHGKSDTVNKTGIIIGRTDNDIEWESLDGEPVNLIILFAVRNDDRETVHVKLLSKVARVLGNDDLTEEILSARTQEKIVNIFIENSK